MSFLMRGTLHRPPTFSSKACFHSRAVSIHEGAVVGRKAPHTMAHTMPYTPFAGRRLFATSSSPSDEAEETLQNYIQSELSENKQPVEDRDFLEDFLKTNNWKLVEGDAYTLHRKTPQEEVLLHANVNPPADVLCSEAPPYNVFTVVVKRSTATLTFQCQYTTPADIFNIAKITATKKETSDSTNNNKNNKSVSLDPQHLDEAGQDAFFHFLKSKGVPKNTGQVIDILLNMRDDAEYLNFLSIMNSFRVK